MVHWLIPLYKTCVYITLYKLPCHLLMLPTNAASVSLETKPLNQRSAYVNHGLAFWQLKVRGEVQPTHPKITTVHVQCLHPTS